jgi:hypothetical protein
MIPLHLTSFPYKLKVLGVCSTGSTFAIPSRRDMNTPLEYSQGGQHGQDGKQDGQHGKYGHVEEGEEQAGLCCKCAQVLCEALYGCCLCIFFCCGTQA